jgi:hypothetical protein
MAAMIYIPGLIAVSVKPQGGNTWQLLGYCRDGVQVREQVRIRPIYGDEGGGPDGIPVDYSYLGEYHEIRMELYKWDNAAMTLVSKRLPNANKLRTNIWDPGWLLKQGNDYFQLQLATEWRFAEGQAEFLRQYQVAIPLSSIEYPLGPKEMVVLMEWTCIPNQSGQLFTA